jgi:hypothetical protein
MTPRFQVAYFHELPLFDVQPLADLVYFQAGRIWAENRTRSSTSENTGSGVAVLLEGEANPKHTNALKLGFRT